MKFELVTPCHNCPFLKRGGIRLRPDRIREIAEPMLEEGAGRTFPCHASHTKLGPRRRRDWEHCAGAILFSLNNGVWTQAMQLAHRFGMWRPQQMRGHARVFTRLSALLKTAQ